MSLLNRTFPAPLHVDISAGALNRLHNVISDPRVAPDSRVAVIISTGSGLAFRAQIEKQIPHAEFFELSDGSLQSAKDIAASLTKYSSVVGVGGGRVLDAAKYAASQANLPMIAVATNLAHDGIASPVSILEHDGTRSSHGVSVPAAVLIDLDVVRSGPVRFLRAGIGDVLSNLNAVADWELAREINGEEVDGLAASMSRTAATSLLNHPGTIEDQAFGELFSKLGVQFIELPSLNITEYEGLNSPTLTEDLISNFHIRVKSGTFEEREDVLLMHAIEQRFSEIGGQL